jgi:competence protein ComEC
MNFLGHVKAEVAVVQSGYRNRFGHPAPEVLQRLRNNVGAVFTSPQCGAWSWSSARVSQQPHGLCQRVLARRYWHAVSAPNGSDLTEPQDDHD